MDRYESRRTVYETPTVSSSHRGAPPRSPYRRTDDRSFRSESHGSLTSYERRVSEPASSSYREFDHTSVDSALQRERDAFNEMQRELRQEAADVADRYEVHVLSNVLTTSWCGSLVDA